MTLFQVPIALDKYESGRGENEVPSYDHGPSTGMARPPAPSLFHHTSDSRAFANDGLMVDREDVQDDDSMLERNESERRLEDTQSHASRDHGSGKFAALGKIVLFLISASFAIFQITNLFTSKQGPAALKTEPQSLSPAEKLTTIRDAIAANPATASLVSLVPPDITSVGINDYLNKTEDPLLRAVSWLIHTNEQDGEHELMTQFALASVYYKLGGDDWVESRGWLNGKEPICTGPDFEVSNWFGVGCTRRHSHGQVTDLSLSENNLTGSFPVLLALLSNLEAIEIDNNSITGPIPNGVFDGMKRLQFVYLQYNRITGNIPIWLKSNPYLRTFFLHGNDFSGDFPIAYCPICETCPHPLSQFGIDCKKNHCEVDNCCDPNKNCFD